MQILSIIRKYKIKIILFSIMIIIFFGWTGLSLADTIPAESINNANINNGIITFLSWIWIVIVQVTGAMMTNNIVYGEFINLDFYMWQMRNIVKNFANFTIGFMFLFFILQGIFQKDKLSGSELMKKVGGFLLAGILIQASRFLIGATLDIEKVTTSTMASLPAIVIDADNNIGAGLIKQANASQALARRHVITIDPGEDGNLEFLQLRREESNGEAPSPEEITDSILPSYKNLSGPLSFLGFSVFRLQNYASLGDTSNLENIDILEFSNSLMAIIIRYAFLITFIFMLILLFVVNIIRIGYLWLVICFSPLIILFIVMKDVVGIDILGGKSETLGLNFDLKTILAFIFQPTIIVSYIGLMIITVGVLDTTLSFVDSSSKTIEEYDLTFTENSISHPTFEVYATNDDLLSEGLNSGRGFFADLIMSIITFALMMGLVVLSAKSLKIKSIENMANSFSQLLTNIPMIPISTATLAADNVLKETTGISLTGSRAGKLDRAGDEALRTTLGLRSAARDDEIEREFNVAIAENNIGRSTKKFFSVARKYKNDIKYLPNSPLEVNLKEFLNKHEDNLSRIGFTAPLPDLNTSQQLYNYLNNNKRQFLYLVEKGGEGKLPVNTNNDFNNYRIDPDINRLNINEIDLSNTSFTNPPSGSGSPTPPASSPTNTTNQNPPANANPAGTPDSTPPANPANTNEGTPQNL